VGRGLRGGSGHRVGGRSYRTGEEFAKWATPRSYSKHCGGGDCDYSDAHAETDREPDPDPDPDPESDGDDEQHEEAAARREHGTAPRQLARWPPGRHVAMRLRECALAAAWLLGSSWSSAQDTPPLEAKKHFDEGKRLFREGSREKNTSKLERACGEFRTAYAGFSSKNVLWNVILCEGATKSTIQQMRHLREYVKRHGTPADGTSEYKELHEQWDPAYRNTGHLEIEAPSGAEINVGGETLVQKAPIPDEVDVAIGAHVIEARLGDRSAKTEIAAVAGRSVKVTLMFTEAKMAPVPAVTSGLVEPHLNHASLGSPGPEPSPRDGGSPVARYVVSLSLVGVGVAGVVTGIAFGSASNSAAERADAIRRDHSASACSTTPQPAYCADANDATDTQNRNATLSKVFLVSGGALAVAGGAVFLLWPKEQIKGASSVAPMVGYGYLGAGYTASF